MTAPSHLLQPITDPALSGLQHGFFTRKGGASSGIYHGLNCGYGSADQHEVVTLNRTRLAQHLGLPEPQLTNAHQIHSATALAVSEALPTNPRPKADALVTNTPGLALGVLTADCQPVLFADQQAGVIGAAHAGWRGALGGVLDATVDAMEALGANRAAISAVIGPCISQNAYEVGSEFRDQFLAEDPDLATFFANGAAPGKYQFDLPGFGASRLRALRLAHVGWTGHCTYSDPDLFYSYRRSCHEGVQDYGRLMAAIRL